VNARRELAGLVKHEDILYWTTDQGPEETSEDCRNASEQGRGVLDRGRGRGRCSGIIVQNENR
jgi:hypothetical protein